VVCDDDALLRAFATPRRWLEAGETAGAEAGVATATMLRVALGARSGAALGAGRLVGGRLVDAAEAGEGVYCAVGRRR
jgi:hypothetical protein